MNITQEVTNHLIGLSDKSIANHSQKFFKAFEGGYGQGDIFLGIRVPIIRQTIKQYKYITLKDIEELLKSKYHEIRLFAVLAMVKKYEKSTEVEKLEIYNLYINNLKYINNWDLIDTTTPHIVGNFLYKKDDISILYTLAKSDILWDRRVSIIATFYFIKNNKFDDALKISKILLNDNHDLIHKAVGWMLREIGKRDLDTQRCFLNKHYKGMPRVMLRYAIEKFEEDERLKYLHGKI